MRWMPSGSLITNTRPQAKRRSTTSSSNNSSSQAATALSGKVRMSPQVESGRSGRGGIANAGCGSAAVAATSPLSGIARLRGHADAASRMQIGPGQRLDFLPRREAEAKAPRQHRRGDRDLDQRQRGADADMRADREGQVGVARARRDLIGCEAVGVEAVRLAPKRAV